MEPGVQQGDCLPGQQVCMLRGELHGGPGMLRSTGGCSGWLQQRRRTGQAASVSAFLLGDAPMRCTTMIV